MDASLQNHILKRLQESLRTPVATDRLTVGIEHEFFLNSQAGDPVSHFQAQEFLRRLAEQPGWYVREKSETDLGPTITRVSFESKNHRFTAVKFDHHPHLFEVAFAYFDSLSDLRNLALNVFEALDRAAEKCSLIRHNKSILDISASDPRVVSQLEYFKALRHYRTKLFEHRGQNPDPHFINYAAVIAATQTHIGGTNWWLNPSLVPNLYCLEPFVLGFSTLNLASDHKTRSQLLRQRWEGYRRTFEGFPLVGFPDLDRWDFGTWCQALLRSPLAGNENDAWAGSNLLTLGKTPFKSWDDFLNSVRDLQIIRPRPYGTLEFRADPAQPDAESIIALAGLRLGLVTALSATKFNSNATFLESKTIWWESVTKGKYLFSPELLEVAHSGLKSRGMNEELLLMPLDRRKSPRVA